MTAAATTNSSRRSRRASTPSAAAVSSPIASAFSDRPAESSRWASAAATAAAAIGTESQPAPLRLPSSHIIAERAASPRSALNTMRVVTAEKP